MGKKLSSAWDRKIASVRSRDATKRISAAWQYITEFGFDDKYVRRAILRPGRSVREALEALGHYVLIKRDVLSNSEVVPKGLNDLRDTNKPKNNSNSVFGRLEFEALEELSSVDSLRFSVIDGLKASGTPNALLPLVFGNRQSELYSSPEQLSPEQYNAVRDL